MLMKRLNNDDLDNDTSIILRLGVSTVLVRRQNILTALHPNASCPQLMREINVYNRVCESISVLFWLVSHWISSSMTAVVSVIAYYLLFKLEVSCHSFVAKTKY